VADKENKEETETDVKEESAPKKSGPNILLVIIIVLLVLILGAGGFLFFTEKGKSLIGLGPTEGEQATEQQEVTPPTDLTYFAVPELLVNLSKSTVKQKKSPFLRLSLKLELPDKESEKMMQAVLPRVIDQFQVYLRQLRVEDIEGAAGIQRLREELLKRVNEVSAPVKVRDVLFEVVLVQ
tara:strand:+ start:2859 stop:3401 length:543 start_codon:yes stop_codon:yes gene_type:complete